MDRRSFLMALASLWLSAQIYYKRPQPSFPRIKPLDKNSLTAPHPWAG